MSINQQELAVRVRGGLAGTAQATHSHASDVGAADLADEQRWQAAFWWHQLDAHRHLRDDGVHLQRGAGEVAILRDQAVAAVLEAGKAEATVGTSRGFETELEYGDAHIGGEVAVPS